MIDLALIRDRYQAAALVAAGTAELVEVADESGAYLDAALKRLISHLQPEDPEVWQEVLAIGRQLRWRLATNPSPASFHADGDEIVDALVGVCERRILASDVATRQLLQDLSARADSAYRSHRPVAAVLLESLADLECESCIVVAASGRAENSIRNWFTSIGVEAPVLRASRRDQPRVVEQAYVIGSPSIFSPSLLTAPRARSITYIFPSWVQDRSLPKSPFSDVAEGAIRPRKRIFKVGKEPVLADPPVDVEDELIPQPVWSRDSVLRPPRHDEVLARKVLLAGGLAIMLDQEGEHIRTLYPEQPPGERVELGDVSLIAIGSYLVLREGTTQSEMLYEQALELLGPRGPLAKASQEEWKQSLEQRLDLQGASAVARSLRMVGIRRADRAGPWTGPTMVRPQADHDFELLLQWLGLPKQPHFELATALRRARLQAAQDVREILEKAVSTANLDELQRRGFIRMGLELPGFRSIIATRVLAISPHLEPVARQEVRLTFEDRSAQWLE
jgi:hypothetical protein